MDSKQTAKLNENWLTLYDGEAYSLTLSHMRELYLLKEDDGTWSLWWGQWQKNTNSKPVKEKTLASGLTFDAAIYRGNSYVEWWFNTRKRQ